METIPDTSITLTRAELCALIADAHTPASIAGKATAALRALDEQNNNLAGLTAEVKALADQARALGVQHPTIFAWADVGHAGWAYARSEIEHFPPRGKYPTYQRDPKTMGGPAEFNGWWQVDGIRNPDALITMLASMRRMVAATEEPAR